MTPAPGRSRSAMRAALVLTILVLAALAGCINKPAATQDPSMPAAEPLAGASTTTQPSPTPASQPSPSSAPTPAPANDTSANSTAPATNATTPSNATSANATVYHDEAEYVAGAGQVAPDPTSCRDAAHPPAASPTDQVTRAPGGICWKLPAGVTQIQNLLVSDVAPHDILTDIQQMDGSGKMLKETTFCTLAKNVTLVDGAKIVSIVVGAGDSSKCAPPPVGVTGVISIRFV